MGEQETAGHALIQDGELGGGALPRERSFYQMPHPISASLLLPLREPRAGLSRVTAEGPEDGIGLQEENSRAETHGVCSVS